MAKSNQITLFNTMSRSKELFVPHDPNNVSLYSCGLTVYDEPHIGNWSTYIAWDLLVRVLRDADYNLNHVQNYTDVGHLISDEDAGEDKMVSAARKSRKTAWEVADHYIERAELGMQVLNITRPTHMPRATQYIDQQITFVKQLENKGFTYIIANEGVYFDSSKLDDYGKLARLDIAGLRSGERVDDTGKKNITDFALWKFSPIDEKRDMEWTSPWGKGFPGWHLECSVMSQELLGESIDIHTGGIDHIPVHHTNEIAQSEALTGRDFVKYWLHRNFIKVDGNKMSKSLGNFYTLDDLQAKGFDPLDFRMLIMQSSYHTESNFSWETLSAARQRRLGLQSFADLRFQTNTSGISAQEIMTTTAQMQTSLRDDLNSPEALALLSQLESKASENGIHKDAEADAFVSWLDSLFGLGLSDSGDITLDQKNIISQRADARLHKDWAASDKLREQLAADTIEVRDTSIGQFWNRNN